MATIDVCVDDVGDCVKMKHVTILYSIRNKPYFT